MRFLPRFRIALAGLLSTIFLPTASGRAEQVSERLCNGHLRFSAQLIDVVFERPVDDWRYIEESLSGSQMRGMANTRGRVTTELIPDNNNAVFDVQLLANASLADGTAERRLVTIKSSTNTAIHARKRVQLNASGMHLHDAYAQCSSAIHIRDVEGPRVVRDFAFRMANRMLGELEVEAARRAEFRAAEQLDEQCNQLLGDANRGFREHVRAPLMRNGVWPVETYCRSSSTQMQFSILVASPSQPSAKNSLAPIDPHYDIVVCLEESIVHNFCEGMLNKSPLTDQQWLQWMKLLTGEPPRALWVHDRAERWHVALARKDPISVVFDNSITLTLRTDEVMRGNRRTLRPMALRVTYDPAITLDGPALTRVGDLDLQFSDNAAGGEDEDMRKFLLTKFNAVFPPQIYFDGLTAPAGGSWEKLRQFRLKQFDAMNGWLVIAYQKEPAAVLTATATVSP